MSAEPEGRAVSELPISLSPVGTVSTARGEVGMIHFLRKIILKFSLLSQPPDLNPRWALVLASEPGGDKSCKLSPQMVIPTEDESMGKSSAERTWGLQNTGLVYCLIRLQSLFPPGARVISITKLLAWLGFSSSGEISRNTCYPCSCFQHEIHSLTAPR